MPPYLLATAVHQGLHWDMRRALRSILRQRRLRPKSTKTCS